jgi:uncharacterized protein (UPF0218 family)
VKLKEPIGTLVQGSFEETVEELRKVVEKEKPARIISVGDAVSKNLVECGILPNLLIVDNREMRKSSQPILVQTDVTIRVQNPQGTITREAVEAVKEAVAANHHAKIVVDGEEDLLTLIAVLYAPEGSFVIYGQPFVGIVIVKVTKQKKDEIAHVLETMKKASKK